MDKCIQFFYLLKNFLWNAVCGLFQNQYMDKEHVEYNI